MIWLILYLLVGFIATVGVYAYQQINPIPGPPEASYLSQRHRHEERTAVVLCTFMGWPVVLFVVIVWGILKLAQWSASSILRKLGVREPDGNDAVKAAVR